MAAEGRVPAGAWQAARPGDDYVLLECRVVPGFEWAGFELLDACSPVAGELSRQGVLHLAGSPVRGD